MSEKLIARPDAKPFKMMIANSSDAPDYRTAGLHAAKAFDYVCKYYEEHIERLVKALNDAGFAKDQVLVELVQIKQLLLSRLPENK